MVEDDPDIADLVALHLRSAGNDVEHIADGRTALERALSSPFDLIVLDLNLPRLDGLEITRRLRAAHRNTPILMLTSRTSELDRVIGLEVGADDYLVKPFSIRELVARVKAQLRRQALSAQATMPPDSAPSVLRIATLQIDIPKRRVTVEGKRVELTAREFDLLLHFARNPDIVFNRTQLLDAVWGHGYSGYEHTVNSHINRLRGKIEVDPANPTHIMTVWGVGYRFAEASSE